MERKFLEDMGISKENVDKIMATNGTDINKAKGDLEDVKLQLETANTTIKERDKQLKSLKESAGDNEELKTQITNLQTANKEAEKKYQNDLKDLKLTAAIKLAVHDKVFDEDMAAGLFDKSKLILTDDGKVAGLDEQLASIKESKAFLFKTDEVKNDYKPDGGKPSEKMSITEAMKYANEHPDVDINTII